MAEIILTGEPSGYKFTSDTLHLTPGYNVVSQSMYPVYRVINPTKGTHYDYGYDFDDQQRGRVIYNSPTKSDTVYFNTPSDWVEYYHGYMPIGDAVDQESAKKEFYKIAQKAKPANEEKDTKAHERVLTEKKSIGGTMNRINYFEKGGHTQNQQAQEEAFMRALLQGDPAAAQQLVQVATQNPKSSAAQLIQNILEAEQQGNTKVSKAAQAIRQVMQQMQGQATSAKWGSKLGYIRSLKYAQGGKTCPSCEKGAPIKVEEKACGGKTKKAKKRYFGGWL